jgi:hypothetical protein
MIALFITSSGKWKKNIGGHGENEKRQAGSGRKCAFLTGLTGLTGKEGKGTETKLNRP